LKLENKTSRKQKKEPGKIRDRREAKRRACRFWDARLWDKVERGRELKTRSGLKEVGAAAF